MMDMRETKIWFKNHCSGKLNLEMHSLYQQGELQVRATLYATPVIVVDIPQAAKHRVNRLDVW